MHTLINLSSKKTGTTFVHQVFRRNAGKFARLCVPPIKEWYFFPRPVPGYLHGLTRKAEHLLGSGDPDLSAEDKLFCRTIEGEESQRGMLCVLMDSAPGKCISMCAMRALKLLNCYPPDCNILVSDPNFLDDLGKLNNRGIQHLKESLAPLKPLYFSVIRHPVAATISLATLRESVEGIPHQFSPKNLEQLYGRQDPLAILHRLIRLGFAKRIIALDFHFLTGNPQGAIEALAPFIDLDDPGELSIPANPNPGKYQPDSDLLHRAAEHLETIHAKNPYRKMYADLRAARISALSIDKGGDLTSIPIRELAT